MKKNKYFVLILALLVFLVLSVVVFQNNFAQNAASINITLIKASSDLSVKIVSPENNVQIIEGNNVLPIIEVGSSIEVIKGDVSVGFKSYTINISEGCKVISQPTAILLEKGILSIEYNSKTVYLNPGEIFDFEQGLKSKSNF